MKKFIEITLTIVSVVFLIGFATTMTGCTRKTVVLPVVGEVEFPNGYIKQVQKSYQDDYSLVAEYTYKENDTLINEDWSKVQSWSSGPEDGMTYTISEDDDTYREYFLIITNPNEDNRLVAIGVQSADGMYTLYTFRYN